MATLGESLGWLFVVAWARVRDARLDAIADQLGHASMDTTMIYARIVDKMTENPARLLEAMLAK